MRSTAYIGDGWVPKPAGHSPPTPAPAPSGIYLHRLHFEGSYFRLSRIYTDRVSAGHMGEVHQLAKREVFFRESGHARKAKSN